MPPSFRGTPPGGLVGQHNETTSDRSDLCSSHGAVPQTHLGRCLKSPWKARHSMSCHGVQRDAACKTWTEEGSQRERSSHLHSVPSTRVGIFFSSGTCTRRTGSFAVMTWFAKRAMLRQARDPCHIAWSNCFASMMKEMAWYDELQQPCSCVVCT